MQTDFPENPIAVRLIQTRSRVSKPHARTVAELAAYRQTVSNSEIMDRALARLAQIKRRAR
jgi:hypothetical protein